MTAHTASGITPAPILQARYNLIILEEACEWLTRVFGFAEYYRHGQPASGIQMHLGEAHIMLSTPRQGRSESPAKLGYGTQMLTIIVPDVEAHYATTKRGRGTIWEELHETTGMRYLRRSAPTKKSWQPRIAPKERCAKHWRAT